MKYKPGILRVQSILFNNTKESVELSLESIAHSVFLLKKAHLIDYVEVYYGDCSSNNIFTPYEIEQLNLNNKPKLDKISYKFFNKNLGTSLAHNILMRSTITEFTLVMNPDIILGPNTLIELMKGFCNNSVGIVEARQIPMEHPKDYNVITGETGWASGACSLFRTELAHQLNGFDDESFFLYCDDVDFSWRVRLAGYKIIYRPSANIFHDKRLNKDGTMIVTSAEEYFSAEGALILAYKYSRLDVLDRIKTVFCSHGAEYHKKALKEFERRSLSGELPLQIDKEHKVAQFINGNYTSHRF